MKSKLEYEENDKSKPIVWGWFSVTRFAYKYCDDIKLDSFTTRVVSQRQASKFNKVSRKYLKVTK